MPAILHTASGHTYARVHSLAGVRGDLVVPNDDLAGSIESSDEWIRRRTGILTRRRASRNVQVHDLAEAAGRAAVELAGLEPGQIDVVIVSTVSWMQPTPAMAPIVAHRIGASPAAAAYDVNAGCAGC